MRGLGLKTKSKPMTAWEKLVSRAGTPGRSKDHWSFDSRKHREQVRRNKEKWERQRREAEVEDIAKKAREKYRALGIDLEALLKDD